MKVEEVEIWPNAAAGRSLALASAAAATPHSVGALPAAAAGARAHTRGKGPGTGALLPTVTRQAKSSRLQSTSSMLIATVKASNSRPRQLATPKSARPTKSSPPVRSAVTLNSNNPQRPRRAGKSVDTVTNQSGISTTAWPGLDDKIFGGSKSTFFSNK